MRNGIFFLVIVVLGLVQLTLLDYVKVWGVKPDLLLSSVCFASLFFELNWALALSVSAGLFKDVFSANLFCINTVLFSLWSFSISRLNRKITIDYNFIRIPLIFVISILHNTISGIILIYSGSLIPWGLFLRIVSLQSLYTALVLPLLFKVGKPFFKDE